MALIRSALHDRAQRLIPGGVNSPVRAMRSVGLDEPLFMRSGVGPFIDDVNGNQYVDWVLSWGPLLFGHADPTTLAAVSEALSRGTTFGAPTEGEVDLAAEIVAAVPSVEMVRLVSSGTEAAMSIVRLERCGARLEAGLAPFRTVQRVGAMLTLFCRDDAVTNYDDAVRSDTERYAALFRHLLDQGVYLAPSQFECMFVSLAHGDDEIDRTIEAVGDFFDS